MPFDQRLHPELIVTEPMAPAAAADNRYLADDLAAGSQVQCGHLLAAAAAVAGDKDELVPTDRADY